MTPREFRLLEQGFERRDDRAWEKFATLGLWILAPYSKKKWTAAQLLGRRRPFVTRPPRPDDDQADDARELAQARALADAIKWARKD